MAKDPNAIEYSADQMAEHERRATKAEKANKKAPDPREEAAADETPLVAAPPAPPAPAKEKKAARK